MDFVFFGGIFFCFGFFLFGLLKKIKNRQQWVQSRLDGLWKKSIRLPFGSRIEAQRASPYENNEEIPLFLHYIFCENSRWFKTTSPILMKQITIESA